MKKWVTTVSMASLLLLAACDESADTKNEPLDATDKHAHHETKEDKKEVKASSDTSDDRSSIVIERKNLINQEEGAVIKIDVPQLSGLKDQKQQDEINEGFLVYGQEFIDFIEENEKALVEYDTGMHAEGTIDFEVQLLNENVASLTIEHYDYTGGAHGNMSKTGYTYDVKTGKELKLSDLFTSDEYVPLLSDLVKVEIEQSELRDLFITEFEQVESTTKFYLTEESLVIVFDPYEYTAFAAGIPEFTIEKSNLPSLKESYK